MKIDIIKKVLMLDTKSEMQKVYDFLGECISRELDQDDKDQVEFKKWKAKKESEKQDEIIF
mgnify:CR=1 FL=1|tara:strand:+ start:104 stop:286 length:183 start_codon:yes stop_codon:yes gene_type:complete